MTAGIKGEPLTCMAGAMPLPAAPYRSAPHAGGPRAELTAYLTWAFLSGIGSEPIQRQDLANHDFGRDCGQTLGLTISTLGGPLQQRG